MKKLVLALTLSFSSQLWALELKVGDVLLQPLNCWSCTLIEEQENSIYSHMGMVIETDPVIKVVEALGSVREMTLEEFDTRTEKGQLLSVRRFQDEAIVSYIQQNKIKFQELYKNQFAGLKYDRHFLWDNVDDQGKEKLYCSEMITKLLEAFIDIKLPIKRMNFNRNREAWVRYFGGNPPDEMWGNAPADFEKSNLFYEVGEL